MVVAFVMWIYLFYIKQLKLLHNIRIETGDFQTIGEIIENKDKLK